jgi:hypothetical protein
MTQLSTARKLELMKNFVRPKSSAGKLFHPSVKKKQAFLLMNPLAAAAEAGRQSLNKDVPHEASVMFKGLATTISQPSLNDMGGIKSLSHFRVHSQLSGNNEASIRKSHARYASTNVRNSVESGFGDVDGDQSVHLPRRKQSGVNLAESVSLMNGGGTSVNKSHRRL